MSRSLYLKLVEPKLATRTFMGICDLRFAICDLKSEIPIAVCGRKPGSLQGRCARAGAVSRQEIRVRSGDNVGGDQFAHAAGSFRARVHRGADAADVAADDRGDVR